MAFGDLIGRLLGSNQTFMPGEQQVAQGGGPPPFWNELSVPASSPALFGVPAIPAAAGLLMGPALGALGYALSNRAHRNQNMLAGLIGGVRAGYNLFDEPIRRQQAEARRMTELGIQQGWFSPYAQAQSIMPPPVQIDPNSLTPAGASGITGNAPLVSAVPNAVPPVPSQQSVSYGGRQVYLNPGVTMGQLYPNAAMPPELASQRVPFNPALAERVALGAKEGQERAFYGTGTNEPLEIARERFIFNLGKGREADAVKGLPVGPDVARSMKIAPGGAVSWGAIEMSPIQKAAVADQAAARQLQIQEFQEKALDRSNTRSFVTGQGFPAGTPIEAVTSEFGANRALKRIEEQQSKIKPGADTAIRTVLGDNGLPRTEYVTDSPTNIAAAKDERELKRLGIEAQTANAQARLEIERARLKSLDDEPLKMILQNAGEQQRTLTQAIENTERILYPNGIANTDPSAAPLWAKYKDLKAQQDDVTTRIEAAGGLLESRHSLPSTPSSRVLPEDQKLLDMGEEEKDRVYRLDTWKKIDGLPVSNNPDQARAQRMGRQAVQNTLDTLVPQIEAASQPGLLGWGKNVDKSKEKYLKSLYTEKVYNWAKKQWEQGYQPRSVMTAAPIGNVPLSPVSDLGM